MNNKYIGETVMTIKKNKHSQLATATSIAEKSSKALSAFMTIVEDLKKTNTEADSVKAANDAVIAAKQQENEMITTVKSQNEKIIQNIENMLAI